MKVAVLGATRHRRPARSCRCSRREHDVVAVSRRPREATAGVRWAAADADRRAAVRRVLEGVDVAYYLVHSLGSRDFEERDRLAAAVRGLGRPSGRASASSSTSAGSATTRAELSRHLRSRAETGERARLRAPCRSRLSVPRW